MVHNLQIFNKKEARLGWFMMAQLFISHSCKDISLAKFLIHLFNYYHIKTWSSFIDLELGTNSNQNIDKALLRCDYLLVLITKNTLASSWITREISIFEKFNPSADIIPLIFNKKVNLNKIVPDLGQYQYVDFTQDLTSGFKTLFAKFGIEFLIPPERRQGHDRRNGRDRRKNSDRRSKDLTIRLHKTFLNLYSEISLITEKDDIDLNNDYELELFSESIRQGAKNYFCYDEIGNLYNPNFVTNLCLNQAWSSFADNSQQNNSKHIKAKYLTFAIAKKMTDKFIVRCMDRRNSNDRRSGSDRRVICKELNAIWSLN